MTSPLSAPHRFSPCCLSLPGGMQVFVKTISGKYITLDILPETTVLALKQQVYNKEGIPVDAQIFVFAGKSLQDEHLLSEYGVMQESTLFLMLRLKGGRSKHR